MAQNLDLSTIFKEVKNSLAENVATLNQADTYNHDHGSHMLQIFDVAQKAVSRKKTASPADQLAYASRQIRRKVPSGSGKVYADGLENASKRFVGKELSRETVGTLIESMMGEAQPEVGVDTEKSSGLLGSLLSGFDIGQAEEPKPQADSGFLGSLLSGLTGSEQQPEPTQESGDMLGGLLSGLMGTENKPPTSSSGSDLLGSLLSGFSGGSQQSQPESNMLEALLSGGQTSSSSSSGNILTSLLSGLGTNQSQSDGKFDASDLLSAALAFFAAKQAGGSNLQAIMQALRKNSPLGQSDHRTQSGALVINSILNMLGK